MGRTEQTQQQEDTRTIALTGSASLGRKLAPIRWSARTRAWLSVLTAVVLLLFVAPVITLIFGAFRTSSPGREGVWTAERLINAWTAPGTFEVLGNSVLLAALTTIVSVSIVVAIVALVARTNMPGRKFVTPLMAIVFAMPSLYFAIGWGMLGNPTVGMLNEVVNFVFGADANLVNINTWAGLIFVISIKLVGAHYMLLIGPFRAMDRALEEASQVAGGGRFKTFMRVSIPIMTPAITSVSILSFVVVLGALDTVLIIGTPADIHVFGSQIFQYINSDAAPDYASASALSLILVVIVLVLVAVQQKLLGKKSYTTITGKSYRTDAWNIGGWRWLAAVGVGTYFFMALLLPLIQLVLGSLQPYFGLFKNLSVRNYVELLSRNDIIQAFGNTITLAVVGGFITMISALTFLIVVQRFPGRLTRFLSLTTWLPIALPGIVLGLAFSWTIILLPGVRGLYGTIGLVGLALIVSALPMAMRVLEGPLKGISAELQESARTSGGSPIRVAAGITAPLLLRSFLAGWFITGMIVGSSFDVPILLTGSKNPTIPVIAYELYTTGDMHLAAALFCMQLLIILIGYLLIRMLSAIGARFARKAPASISG